FHIVLYQHSVMEHRNAGLTGKDTIGIESGRSPDNVIGLPLAGSFCRVYQWNTLFIDATRLAVGIGAIVVAIQHLYLVQSLHEDTAVSTPLPFTHNLGRRSPLHMQLVVSEFLLGADTSFTTDHGKSTIGHFPLGGRGAVFLTYPLIQRC